MEDNKSVKSYSTNSRISLLEKGEILGEESNVADTYEFFYIKNEFFSNDVKELKIDKDD